MLLPRGRRVDEAPGFAEGDFVVQDPSTLGAVELLDVRPGLSVLDFCAAPGGKTAQIAWRMKGEGRLVAQEVNPRRLARLRENLARLKLDWVETVPFPANLNLGPLRADAGSSSLQITEPCSYLGPLALACRAEREGK